MKDPLKLRTEEPNNRITEEPNRGFRAAKSLFDDKEATLNPVFFNPIPHHACLSYGNHVLEIDNLSGGQRRVAVRCAESALAHVEQPAGHLLTRRIVEREFQVPIGWMTAFGTAFGGGHRGFVGSFLLRMHALPPFRKASVCG